MMAVETQDRLQDECEEIRAVVKEESEKTRADIRGILEKIHPVNEIPDISMKLDQLTAVVNDSAVRQDMPESLSTLC